MSIEKEKSGSLVLRCTEQAVIQEVLFSSINLQTSELLDQPFSVLAQTDNLDPLLHFLEALKQFGNAEGWHLPIVMGKESLYMTFSGLSLDHGFIIVGNIYQQNKKPVNSKKPGQGEAGMNAQISLEDNQPFTSVLDENELLDELSRLNNELINSKRELIRQNMANSRQKKKENPDA